MALITHGLVTGMRRRCVVTAGPALGLFLLVVFASGAVAQEARSVAVEAAIGTALSIPVPLTIEQNGFAPLSISAHFATRPFADAPYYAWRIGVWQNGRAWELQ